ncbi:hypothetical protein [Opitutus terrae]|uniref:Lipoprotein n=1 Tax=Opitutus terrae (strain DSM 11246 / JCM 15787 / PB90-1) TaxID=452637 RepID=B1ZQ02_OPITP|nr:hypothetical protein [Opitutus terrae]ACB77721.1 hypothetical protein Oter_4450 [Opitutus terrae PB90-1]
MSPQTSARVFFCGGALLLAGCAALPTQFGGTWPLPVERRSSAAIDLARPIVKPAGGGYQIEGYLTRQFGEATMAHSHVDVQFLGADGSVLREDLVNFEPRELPAPARLRAPSARYQLQVPAAPPGTAKLRVAAHDQPHTR